MKNAIKILALICSFIMLLGGCSKNKPNEEVTGNVKDSVSTDNSSDDSLFRKIYDDLPETMDYQKEEINIVMRSEPRYNEEMIVSGDSSKQSVVQSAVYQRNREVEERLNVLVNFHVVDNVGSQIGHGPWFEINPDIQSGSSIYDIAMGSACHAVNFAIQGSYRNLNLIDNLNLNKEYWAKDILESMTMNNATFFATGSISTYFYDSIYVIYFNKDLAEMNQINPTELYQKVLNYQWTLGDMIEISKDIYNDKNGNNVADDGDIFGFGMQVSSATDGFWSACDITSSELNDEGIPVSSVNVFKLSDVVDRLNNFVWNNDGVVALVENPVYVTEDKYLYTNQFANDQLVFVTDWLYSTSTYNIRNMDSDYGILPYPMYDEDQGEYYSYIHDKMSVVGIPVTVSEDKEGMIGAYLETMASASQNIVMPAYYEKALTGQYIRDLESVQTLDLIIRSTNKDLSWYYYYTLNTNLLREQIKAKQNTISSDYKKIYKLADQRFKDVYLAFDKYKDN